ncbi:MAG: DedA family protein [Candidatus Omnitrophica bacterium]|nr:DedA family protein [Candidatus Omnitrophota bacterium]
MDWLKHIADFFMHLDHHLAAVTTEYGTWTYLILFLIVFCETGLVVTPFLPGDSLLFVVGALSSAGGSLNLGLSLGLLSIAAILGDTINYFIGKKMGPSIFRKRNIKFLNIEHLKQTEAFFEKYGGKTIIIARFVPIVRTFAPFVAGMGSMAYGRFIFYNVIGALMWVFGLVLAGYFFGKIPIVEKNFSKVILLIIFVSILPGIIELIRHRKNKN